MLVPILIVDPVYCMNENALHFCNVMWLMVGLMEMVGMVGLMGMVGMEIMYYSSSFPSVSTVR